MRFHVGPIAWQVQLVGEPIELAGRQCWGVCNCQDHKIVVWDKAGPRKRLVILIHELTHAWLDAVGPPEAGEEGLCNFVGTIMAQFVIDVSRQRMQMWRFLTGSANRGLPTLCV